MITDKQSNISIKDLQALLINNKDLLFVIYMCRIIFRFIIYPIKQRFFNKRHPHIWLSGSLDKNIDDFSYGSRSS
jgi:hypothetical protein